MRSLHAHVCLLILALSLLEGCGRVADDFRGDTEGGRIQLDVERVENVGVEDVTTERFHPGLRAYQRVLNKRLPVGADLTVGTSVAEFGTYRRGGGWISSGSLHVGRHAVLATAIAATASNPESLLVQVDVDSASPERNRVSLVAQRPGPARISLSVQALDSAGRPTADDRVMDSVTISIE
jgi:hypothetical protein